MVAGWGGPAAGGVADAEGPDLFHIEIGSGHESFVPDEGQQAPIGHVHGITGGARGPGVSAATRETPNSAGDGRRPAEGPAGSQRRGAREAEKAQSSPSPCLARRRAGQQASR